ncbi:HAD family hydrolase [Peptacetobacter sp.]|uniref:HAD family hydrolase n=1 Tax=unclassified Peptacetobacter TaxID=2991974 RepID=UPI00262E3B50|nr:HAD family hydrolase [Peptacetobacter sp.]
MNRPDSIIFDLDGTMWDTRDDVAEIWNEVFEKYGFEASLTGEIVASYMGMPYDEAMEQMLGHIPEETRKIMMDECASIEAQTIDRKNGGKIFPNVKETLDELVKDYRLFIVSNCQKGYIEAFLRINGLEKYFEDTENAENTGLQKGENNKLVIERNDLKNPVYVGDTPGDARSAKFVGIPFIYAEYGFDTVEEYDAKIDDFSDLLKLDMFN